MNLQSNKIKDNPDLQNDWAFDVKNEPIHISFAESGAKGYYCMGCGLEMDAYKRKKKLHLKSFFRHLAKNVDKSKIECHVASKEYREHLAKNILHRLKELKVPDVFKFPPKGVIGNPNVLQEKTTIKAHTVKSEISFFEDEEGTIKWGKNPEIENRYLLIRPDITFFDENEKPILFVEFVITHKPDIDKITKLKRIGINTVQIIIPKVPEEEIENCLRKVTKVKWVYNEIESYAEYIPTSSGITEGILSIDEEQRKLFEESYSCRASQLGNLVRAINRCMESQSYKRVEQHFEHEISRIEKASSGARSKLDDMETNFEREVYTEFESEENTIEERRREFYKIQKQWKEYYSDVEKRFYTKSRKLREEQEDTNRQITTTFGVGNTEEGIRNDHDDRIKHIREQEEAITREEEKLSNRRTANRNEEINHRGFFKQLDSEEQSRYGSEIEKLSRNEIDTIREIAALPNEFVQKEEQLGEEYSKLEKGIATEFKQRSDDNKQRITKFRERVILSMEGNDHTDRELPDRLKKLSEARRFLYNWEAEKRNDDRHRIAIEAIRKGNHKKWNQ